MFFKKYVLMFSIFFFQISDKIVFENISKVG